MGLQRVGHNRVTFIFHDGLLSGCYLRTKDGHLPRVLWRIRRLSGEEMINQEGDRGGR